MSSILIAFEDEAFSAVDRDFVAASEVLWLVIVLGSEAHTWAMGEQGLLGQLLFFEKHWERGSATVNGVDLLDLNLLIGKVVVEDVILVAAIV